ncbi:MAG: PHP domain-containing protein, partial [Planctomycetota bacterium]
MPEESNQDRRKHPAAALKFTGGGDEGAEPATFRATSPSGSTPYAELHCKSNFSFLRGASHPEELVDRAADLGYAALAITDRNSLAGVVRMHVAAKARNLKLIVGAEIVPDDAPAIALYAPDRPAYARLARLITRGRLRTPKGQCEIHFADLAELSAGLIGTVLGEADEDDLRRYAEVFGDRLYLAASAPHGGDDAAYLQRRYRLSRRTGVPMVATNDVHYHEPDRRFLQDVLVCIREHCTIEQAGQRLFPNAERYIKEPARIARLFADYPDALARTLEVAGRCNFSLDELRYDYPEEICPGGLSPGQYLARLTWAGARERYADGIPAKVRRLIEHELRLIEELRYEPYFLTVWDIVRFARSRDILCQGRGSAANSVVCYCLGVTAVDPDRIDMLFERFCSRERNEPPDIDVDFEHERREEVFQYIYDKYGRERAGIVAEVITYRARSAVRDVGKALGLSLDRVDAMAKSLEWWGDEPLLEERLRQAGMDPTESTVRALVGLFRQIVGFPRHLSQHVGGFVITQSPLCEMVPLENGAMPDRTFIEWDKDDIDALGILKVDCLALGMLTAIHKCFEMVNDSVLGSEELEARSQKEYEITRDGREHFLTSHFSLLT